MYDMNEYANAQVGPGRRTDRRGWLAVAAGAVALLVVLLLIVAACKARSDSVAGAAGASATETPSGAAGESGGGGAQVSGLGDNPGGGSGGGPGDGPGGQNPGGEPGNENPGGGPDDANPGDDPDEDPDENPNDDPDQAEPEPLSIEASLDTVLPGGQCFASGTIAVSGGAYPVTVHYQWRRTALVDGQLTYKAVSAVQNITFDAPGSRSIQVNDIPPNGENIWFAVTGPKNLNSDWVAYDTCGGGPGGFAPNG